MAQRLATSFGIIPRISNNIIFEFHLLLDSVDGFEFKCPFKKYLVEPYNINVACPQGIFRRKQKHMVDSIVSKWYAMRVTYGREMKLKSHLDSIGITNFIPMRITEVIRKGYRQKQFMPVVNNLIFVQSTRPTLNLIKKEVEYRTPVRYIMDKLTREPITIPDKDMQYFIAVAGTLDEQLIYTSEVSNTLERGAKVRVTAGPFAGIEGILVRIKKDRRVMVRLQGFIAVITAYINPALLEVIDTYNVIDK